MAQITIDIPEVQLMALNKLGLDGDAQKIAQSALHTAVKARFNAYAAKAEQRVGKIYDEAVKNGFTAPDDRDTFIKRQTGEVQEILNNL